MLIFRRFQFHQQIWCPIKNIFTFTAKFQNLQQDKQEMSAHKIHIYRNIIKYLLLLYDLDICKLENLEKFLLILYSNKIIKLFRLIHF